MQVLFLSLAPPPCFPALLHQLSQSPRRPWRRAFRARVARARPPHPCAPLPGPRARHPHTLVHAPAPAPSPAQRSGRCFAVCAGPQCGCAHWAASGAGRAAVAAAQAAAAGPGASGGGGGGSVGSAVELSLGLQQRGAAGVESHRGEKGRPGRKVPEQPFSLDLGVSCPPPRLQTPPPHRPPQPRPLTGGGGVGGLRGAAMPLPR